MKQRIFVNSEEIGGSLSFDELKACVDTLVKKFLKKGETLHSVWLEVEGTDDEYHDSRTIRVSIYREELPNEEEIRLKKEAEWQEQRKEEQRKAAKQARDREKKEYLRLHAKYGKTGH